MDYRKDNNGWRTFEEHWRFLVIPIIGIIVALVIAWLKHR